MYHDTAGFSACNAVVGPFAGLPFEPAGDDITEQISAHRHEFPFSGFLGTLDPPNHTRVRALLSKLMTPRRLKENEAAMWLIADRQLDVFAQNGKCEFFTEYAQPFSLLVIADLLGVPAEDHDAFVGATAACRRPRRYSTILWSFSRTVSPPTSRIAGVSPTTTC